MKMHNITLREPVVCMLEGYVEFAARDVAGPVVRRDGRNPVVDENLGVDRVSWCKGEVGVGRGGNHVFGEGEKRAVAFLDCLPSSARLHA